MTTLPAHAKYRPPSSAKRWLACAGSVSVVPMYPNDESEASTKGDVAHDHLENAIRFGILPDTDDPDNDLNVRLAYEWVLEQKRDYIERHKKCEVYAEQVFHIPETGEHGTGDITLVTPRKLHIADYKNGYVPVEVKINAQLMLYLLGAIAMYGERTEYEITIIQPNYNHVDGPIRSWTVDAEAVEWFRNEVRYAVQLRPDEFKAGPHCKTTYCPHRGACAEFAAWARTEGADAWWPSEVHALDDVQLQQALDHADLLSGYRDELRKEAMRRILNMDRKIDGYKIVRSRQDRSFRDDAAREQAFDVCRELGATDDQLYSRSPESVAGIERFFKAKYKNFGNGAWKKAFDNNVKEHIREFSGSLTLERAIDGRPAHARGNEFAPITQDPFAAVNDPFKLPTTII
jgi:hypothetical protein